MPLPTPEPTLAGGGTAPPPLAEAALVLPEDVSLPASEPPVLAAAEGGLQLDIDALYVEGGSNGGGADPKAGRFFGAASVHDE